MKYWYYLGQYCFKHVLNTRYVLFLIFNARHQLKGSMV